MDEWADRKANVRDILTHVSGLPRCVGFGVSWVFWRFEVWGEGGGKGAGVV